MARKSKYDATIPPNIEKIKEWLSQDIPEKKIAQSLGVAYSTWQKWKKEKEDFSVIFGVIRQPKIIELENTMFQLATGYTIRLRKVMKVRDPGGGEHLEEYEEDVHVPANFNALRFLLTNWSDKYANDPALMKIRREEFEHKKKQDELNSW